MTTPLVVVIPNYNGGPLLETLQALAESLYSALTIHVVADAYTANALNLALARFPSIALLRNNRNRSFAAGANRGLAEAARLDFHYAFLLNAAAGVAPKTITLWMTTIESDGRVATVMSKILFYDEPSLIQRTGISVSRNCDCRQAEPAKHAMTRRQPH